MKASRAMMRVLKAIKNIDERLERLELNLSIVASKSGVAVETEPPSTLRDEAYQRGFEDGQESALLLDDLSEEEETPDPEHDAFVASLVDDHTKDQLLEMLGEYQDDVPGGNKARIADELARHIRVAGVEA